MEINLNKTEVENYLSKNDFDSLTEYLKEHFKLNRNEDTGQIITKPPSKASIEIISKIIDFILQNFEIHPKDTNLFHLLQQCFISLRNSAANGKNVQNLILDYPNLIQSVHSSLKILISLEFEDCLKILLQFLGNLVVDNERTQIEIWNKFSNEFLFLLKNTKPIATPTLMILFNIFRTFKHLLPTSKDFIENIITWDSQGIDFAQLILELYFSTDILCELYPNFETIHRLATLELIHEIVLNDQIISIELLNRLVFEFKRKSDCILKTVTDYVDRIEPSEVVRLLDVLASASSQESYLPSLQQDKGLLINCIFLLKSIHSIGKETDNHFSAIQKLSELTLQERGNPEIQKHPGFGFKASLIRMIGNLCWKHLENQNQVRDLDCIPLLLDCCNIDARNPLIIQWVILAVRNLCEGNQENQAVIAGMARTGTVDSSVLKEMGLTLHDDGEKKLVVVPLNDLKK